MKKNILDIVENCPSAIEKEFIVKNFKKGDKIVQQGFEAKSFHILLNGEIIINDLEKLKN